MLICDTICRDIRNRYCLGDFLVAFLPLQRFLPYFRTLLLSPKTEFLDLVAFWLYFAQQRKIPVWCVISENRRLFRSLQILSRLAVAKAYLWRLFLLHWCCQIVWCTINLILHYACPGFGVIVSDNWTLMRFGSAVI